MFDIKHTSQMVRVISSLNLWRTIFHTFPKSRGFIFPIHLQRVIRISCSPIATCQTPNTMPPLSRYIESTFSFIDPKGWKKVEKNSRHCFLVFSILPCRSVCTQWSLPPGLKGYLLRLLLLYSIHLIKI